MFKRGKHQKAQIWVETVIYTLIALVMIGTVVSIVKPKIEESQDRAIIQQSKNLINSIDSIIFDIKSAAGNQRIIEVGIKEGNLLIDAENDRIIFEIESRYEYSEPGQYIQEGASEIIAHTQKIGKFNNVTLTRDYGETYDITYLGKDELKTITKSPTPYKMTISNEGENKFEDTSSSCTAFTVDTECTNSIYEIGYSKFCINGICKYISDRITINIDIT